MSTERTQDLQTLTELVLRLLANDDVVDVPEVRDPELADLRSALTALAAHRRHLVSTAHLDAVFFAVPTVLLQVDGWGRIIALNEAALDLVGAPCEGHLLEHVIADLSAEPLPSPPTAPELTAPTRLTLLNRDGEARIFEFRATVLLDPSGRLDGWVVSAVDHTSDARALEAMAQARHEALVAAEARRRLLATMSHNVRTPLHGVLAAARLLETDVFGRRGRENLAALRTCAETVSSLTRTVVDLAEWEAGELAVRREPTDLRDILRACSDRVRPMVSADVHLSSATCDSVPDWILGDGARLGQAIDALLSNAARHTSCGFVGVRAWAEEGRLAICVQDSGEGIPADQLDQATASFEKLADAGGRTQGFGLGLALVHALCGAMGGSLELSSTPGQGTRAQLLLPLQPAAAPHSTPTDGPSALAGLRVLMVDDHVLNRTLVRRMLERLGATVLEADSGEQAVDMTIGGTPESVHFVLMDLEMPGIDGVEATRRIRQRDPDLVVIAFTAQARERERQRCIDAGMDGFLTKPLEIPALEHLVQRLVPRASSPSRTTSAA